MPRKAKQSYKDYDYFNEEVKKAYEEGRLLKVGNVYRVFLKEEKKTTKKDEE